MAKPHIAGYLLFLAFLASPAAASPGWDCTFEGAGSDPARTIAHLDIRGHEIIEPHWPASIAYRVLVDTRDMLIAARGYDIPPTFRSDARGSATVLILNKRDGHLRRSTSALGEPYDRIETGFCERR
ncbi:MAG TPA: hypothetical protein VMD53_17165 [Rhizomicrobium sp.]|nr:hypothetical protein [Rhizomicrobium sp.]